MSRIALVTGGTRGIGAEISRQLKAAGRTVVASYAGNDEAAKAFQAETGIVVKKFDAGDYEQCKAAVEAIHAELGKIEILVNNAGITRDATMSRLSRDMWDAVMDTNLGSCFNLSKLVWEDMRAAKFGRIVNIGSINGQAGQYGQVNYAAAKSGIHGFTKALAQEGARFGITVNAVAHRRQHRGHHAETLGRPARRPPHPVHLRAQPLRRIHVHRLQPGRVQQGVEGGRPEPRLVLRHAGHHHPVRRQQGRELRQHRAGIVEPRQQPRREQHHLGRRRQARQQAGLDVQAMHARQHRRRSPRPRHVALDPHHHAGRMAAQEFRAHRPVAAAQRQQVAAGHRNPTGQHRRRIHARRRLFQFRRGHTLLRPVGAEPTASPFVRVGSHPWGSDRRTVQQEPARC